jgi:phosphoribosylformylglycinamidine synthase
MTAHVYVTLKRTVLDPQGQTIHGALKKLRHGNVEEVRQGKYFQLKLADGLSEADANAEVQKIASEVLCNPVMEEFSFKIEP